MNRTEHVTPIQQRSLTIPQSYSSMDSFPVPRFPGHVVLVFVLLLLPYYAFPLRVDVLEGETPGHLKYALLSIEQPSLATWLGSPYIRPVAFNAWTLLSYSLFGLDAFGWHLLVIVGYIITAFAVLRLFARLSGSLLAGVLGALYWSLHFAHNHVLFVTNGGNFIHLLFFVLSLNALLDVTQGASRRRLLMAVFFYTVALFSNDIAPLFLVAYFCMLTLFSSGPLLLVERLQSALKKTVPFLIVTIPYILILIAKRDIIRLRDSSHKVNWDVDIFWRNLDIGLHWLAQVPSDSWQDVYYRQMDLFPFTVVMYFMAAFFLACTAYVVYTLIRARFEVPQRALGKPFLFSVAMVALFIVPFCFALHVTHHYFLLPLLFYAHLLGMYFGEALRALLHRCPSLGVQLGSVSYSLNVGSRVFRQRFAMSVFLLFGLGLTAHAYVQSKGHYLNPSKPTGHLFLNNTRVYDALRLRSGEATTDAEYVVMNLEEVHFQYHFQSGEWFRMYQEDRKAVEVFNRPDLKKPETLLKFGRETIDSKSIDREKVLVLYFENGVFRKDLTDHL